MSVRFVILGGGPAGNQAATTAARLGAHVTMIERDIVGGAAHLLDCIPSKSMIATGGAISFSRRLSAMGLEADLAHIDRDGLSERIQSIQQRLSSSTTTLLESQGVEIVRGAGRFVSPHEILVETTDGPAIVTGDAFMISTGSRPRIPDWAHPDGDRVLTTRQAYPPPEIPKHLIVIGSGVTGVEFVHMFSSFGSEVSLVVSRQQVLPSKDPEAAAILEDDFLARGVQLYKGSRAIGIERSDDGVGVQTDDGRTIRGSHALLAIGSVPNSDDIGLEAAGVEADKYGFISIDHNCLTNVNHIYAAGDVSGKLPLASVASMQGRKIAERLMGMHALNHRHLDYDKAASAIFTEPEIADVGLAEADAFAHGRKIRVTKVPFAATAKALINSDTRGFVKIISDPLTGQVLGGSIVGRHAAELISVLALAVTANLKVNDILESLFAHPTLGEALADAAE
jgi:pyruvate/2-oxoglutarate dehydrogenase complex dihydrolipoamide dehydrogenase (E3) component